MEDQGTFRPLVNPPILTVANPLPTGARHRILSMRALFYSVQVLDGFETTEDNVRGLLPELIENSGFSGVSRRGEIATIFGTLALYSAVSPS